MYRMGENIYDIELDLTNDGIWLLNSEHRKVVEGFTNKKHTERGTEYVEH